jgi:hypothetical protein
MLRNTSGHRVDSALNCTGPEVWKIKNRKLCNPFHLLGTCPFLNDYGNCQHDHTAVLNSKQLVALRAVARQSPCLHGLYCDDPDCLLGHRCTKENCSRTSCRFPSDMHGVDTNVVHQV